jgi:hypothetical protein
MKSFLACGNISKSSSINPIYALKPSILNRVDVRLFISKRSSAKGSVGDFGQASSGMNGIPLDTGAKGARVCLWTVWATRMLSNVGRGLASTARGASDAIEEADRSHLGEDGSFLVIHPTCTGNESSRSGSDEQDVYEEIVETSECAKEATESEDTERDSGESKGELEAEDDGALGKAFVSRLSFQGKPGEPPFTLEGSSIVTGYASSYC